MSIPSSIRRTFLYSHFFLSLCAAAMWLHTLMVAGLPLKLSAAFLILPAATVVYYNFHKFSYRLDSLRPDRIWKTIMDPSVRFADRASFLLGGCVVLIGLSAATPVLIAAWSVAALIAVMYTLPVIRFPEKIRRLREVPLLKIVTVSLVWALATAFIPLLEAGKAADAFGACCFKFSLVFALCVPFEIRDQQRETERDIPSVMRYGRARVVLVALSLLAWTTGQHYLQLAAGSSTGPLFLSHLLPASLAALWLFITRPQWPGWYFKLVVDGTMLLPFLLLILF